VVAKEQEAGERREEESELDDLGRDGKVGAGRMSMT
jgi:hypothetical protein